MNKLLVDLDETVTKQSTTISDLTNTVERFEQITKDNSNLESRIKILKSLTANNISQALLDVVVINSANLHTTSSIHSFHHDTCTSTRNNKRKKKNDTWPVDLTECTMGHQSEFSNLQPKLRVNK